jgi:hypothetical protein
MCPSTFFREKKASEWSVGSLYVVFLRMVAGACNHPNCLVIPFRTVLIRLAA